MSRGKASSRQFNTQSDSGCSVVDFVANTCSWSKQNRIPTFAYSILRQLDFDIFVLDQTGEIMFTNREKVQHKLPVGMSLCSSGRVRFDVHLIGHFQNQFTKLNLESADSPIDSVSYGTVNNTIFEFQAFHKCSEVSEQGCDTMYCLVIATEVIEWTKKLTKILKFNYNLTNAEVEICKHIYQAEQTKAIALQRKRSAETVKSQIKSILRKTQCRNRNNLVLKLSKMSYRLIRDAEPLTITAT